MLCYLPCCCCSVTATAPSAGIDTQQLYGVIQSSNCFSAGSSVYWLQSVNASGNLFLAHCFIGVRVVASFLRPKLMRPISQLVALAWLVLWRNRRIFPSLWKWKFILETGWHTISDAKIVFLNKKIVASTWANVSKWFLNSFLLMLMA